MARSKVDIDAAATSSPGSDTARSGILEQRTPAPRGSGPCTHAVARTRASVLQSAWCAVDLMDGASSARVARCAAHKAHSARRSSAFPPEKAFGLLSGEALEQADGCTRDRTRVRIAARAHSQRCSRSVVRSRTSCTPPRRKGVARAADARGTSIAGPWGTRHAKASL
jgi:hypothetical protein